VRPFTLELSAEALDLAETKGGTRLRLRVRAGAKRVGVLGVHGGALRVAVTAPPDRGKANRAVLALMADILRLAPGDLEILSGQLSPDKSLHVPLSRDAVRERLAAVLPD